MGGCVGGEVVRLFGLLPGEARRRPRDTGGSSDAVCGSLQRMPTRGGEGVLRALPVTCCVRVSCSVDCL
jgi:hypothetical protein